MSPLAAFSRNYLTVEAAAALVTAFEDCRLTLADWHHEEHLMVALHYVRQHELAEAIARMRAGIQRLNSHLGIATTPEGGYHETLTICFTRLVHSIAAELGADCPWPDLAAAVLARLADKYVVLRYYSRARVMSAEARRNWVEPDLQPLPAAPAL